MKMDIVPRNFFFDQPEIEKAVERAGKQALARSGARHRLTAQRSMRYVTPPKSGKPRRVSSPGQPPLAVRPHPWVRKHWYYAWDPSTKSVVSGPALFGPASGAPRTLEKGGQARIKNRRRTIRRVGDGGEVRIGLPSGMGDLSRTAKQAIDWRGNAQWVTYAKIRTTAQAALANANNEWLYGPEEFTAQIEPRPTAGPALDKILPSLPRELAGTVRP